MNVSFSVFWLSLGAQTSFSPCLSSRWSSLNKIPVPPHVCTLCSTWTPAMRSTPTASTTTCRSAQPNPAVWISVNLFAHRTQRRDPFRLLQLELASTAGVESFGLECKSCWIHKEWKLFFSERFQHVHLQAVDSSTIIDEAAQSRRPNSQHKAHVSESTLYRKSKTAALTNLRLRDGVQMMVFFFFFFFLRRYLKRWFPLVPACLLTADRCRFSVPAVPGGDDLLRPADYLQHGRGK